MTDLSRTDDPRGTLLSPVWTLRRADRNAICYIAPRITGHELCLTLSGHPVWRHVCRTQDELMWMQKDWRTALRATGWKPSGGVAEP